MLFDSSGNLLVNVAVGGGGGGGGSVAVTSLPSTPAGTNTIGSVNVNPKSSARTDKSGTIAAGGTAQNVFAASAATNGFYFQNLSTSPMWIRDDGTAASAGQGSIYVAPNYGYYECPPSMGAPTAALSVYCATTGAAYTCKVS